MKICSVNLDRENNFLTLSLIRPVGAWFVLRGSARPPGPDSSCRPSSVSRGPAYPAGPWSVLRSPDWSFEPWFDVRGPDPSCGAPIRIARLWSVPWSLICPAGPWFVLRALMSCGALIRATGPDLSCGALIRLAGPSRGARVRSVEPDSSCGVPIRPAGPWNLIKNRPQLGAQAGLGGPASVWRAKNYDICWSPVIGLWGAWPECPPGTATAMASTSKRACSRAQLHISAKNDEVCGL